MNAMMMMMMMMMMILSITMITTMKGYTRLTIARLAIGRSANWLHMLGWRVMLLVTSTA